MCLTAARPWELPRNHSKKLQDEVLRWGSELAGGQWPSMLPGSTWSWGATSCTTAMQRGPHQPAPLAVVTLGCSAAVGMVPSAKPHSFGTSACCDVRPTAGVRRAHGGYVYDLVLKRNQRFLFTYIQKIITGLNFFFFLLHLMQI